MKNFYLSVMIAAFPLLFTSLAPAGVETDDPARPSFGQTGQIFTFKFTPEEKRITLSLVDKPIVTLGPSRVHVVGRMVPREGTSKPLNISPKENSFEILDQLDPNAALEIDVRDRVSNKTETFKVEQKPRR